MSFEEALREHFPDALPESDFVTRTYQMLWRHGFTDRSAIACVSVCRDEMTRPLIDTIQRTWGEAFNFSSLAGMVFLGKTGFLTAQQHAPRKDGIERYVFFGLPHIAISQNGEPGVCYRPGRDERSPACGALAAFREELRSGSLSLETDPDDIERSLMNQRLHRVLPPSAPTDIVSVTRAALECIREDLERMVDLTVEPSTGHWAILTGIQIHSPSGVDYVSPGSTYAIVDGERRDLSLSWLSGHRP